MLHPLKLISHEAEMMRLVQFQRGLLELAISLKNGAPNTEATFKQVLDKDTGAWFWSRYVRQRKQNDVAWKRRFDALCNQCPQATDDQQKILDAFDWDIRFTDHLTDARWAFKYPNLPQLVKDAIQPLFEHCYTYLGSTGYGKSVHGRQGLTLTRDIFLKDYEVTNSGVKVCPVCDVRIAKHPDTKTFLLTVDHYFAKTELPFLSLHPGNLVPSCSNCNSIFKSVKSLLTDNPTNTVPDDISSRSELG